MRGIFKEELSQIAALTTKRYTNLVKWYICYDIFFSLLFDQLRVIFRMFSCAPNALVITIKNSAPNNDSFS